VRTLQPVHPTPAGNLGQIANLGRRWHHFAAGVLLIVMFSLGISSMANDSATVDEVAHIAAAYSYLHYGDYRLNPEHPPLIKDLAGLPLQFMDLKFPDSEPAWTTEVNGQWNSGLSFLYHIGNDAQAILFWARLPILLLAVGFGIVLYRFVLHRWDKAVALLALLFYTLSPNIIAHAHYVTTDLGASVFMFLALMGYIRFIERPNGTNIFLLSLGLTGAQLAKFSSVLLYPILFLVTIGIVLAWKQPQGWVARVRRYVGGLVAASILSIIWAWIYYIPHVMHMPHDVQARLISGSLNGRTAGVANGLITLSHYLPLKSLVQYLLGLAMVFGRVTNGSITYFNGEVSDQSFPLYFPEILIIKTQVAFLALGLITLGLMLAGLYRRGLIRVIGATIREHLALFTLGFFAVCYFVTSVAGNLNLGIRHILPIFVPLFILVAVATAQTARRLAGTRWRVASASALAILLTWYTVATLWIYPSFTAYFNELIGGPGNAYKYVSDSSVDWGQDLLRLKQYVDAHPEITHLALDYFGGADARYYFCERTYDSSGLLIANTDGYDCADSIYESWHPENGPYTGQYIAVSETFLENDRWYSIQRGDRGYDDLRNMRPIAKIGYSIYLFKLY
jgi:Dolichyl-phosphate-mannose-protein mannosyltransferase